MLRQDHVFQFEIFGRVATGRPGEIDVGLRHAWGVGALAEQNGRLPAASSKELSLGQCPAETFGEAQAQSAAGVGIASRGEMLVRFQRLGLEAQADG